MGSRYRHRGGATAGHVLLAVDKAREERVELDAYEEYLRQLNEQAEDKKESGLFGTILGGLLGFFVGGVPGAMAGSSLGGAAGGYSESWDDFSENEKLLAGDAWGGGKFNYRDMKQRRGELHELNKEQRQADQVSYGIDLAMAAVTIGTAAGASQKVAEEFGKESWKELTFKEKIGSLVGKGGKETAAAEAAKGTATSYPANTLLDPDILSVVEQGGAILDPTNMFGGSFTPFQTLKDFTGALQDKTTGIGELARYFQGRGAVQRGDTNLAAYLLDQTYDPQTGRRN